MFFDPALSASGKLACATCHDPRYAYGPPPGRAIAFGGPGMNRSGTRAVPSLRYLREVPPFKERYQFVDGDVGPVGGLMWDGRGASLEEQAKLPLLAANEMANSSAAEVARKLARRAYAGEFKALFGRDIFKDPDKAFAAGLRALAAFEQVPEEFFPYSSRYDAYLRGEIELTDQEERGAAIFKDPDKGNCASCHLGASRDGVPPPFTDFDFVNVGVPRNRRLPVNTDPHYYDLGLCGPQRLDLAGKRELCGYFRSPTVRNTAIRDAYFHNGVFNNLRQVVEFYNERDLHPEKFYSRNPDGSVHPYDDLPPAYPDDIDHDPPLNRKPGAEPALTDADIDDLIAFLESLTDADVTRPQPQPRPQPRSQPQPPAAAADAEAWRIFNLLAAPGRDGRAAWERWASAAFAFRRDGADPGPWRNARHPGMERFELLTPAEFPNLRQVVGGRMVPVTDPLAIPERLVEVRLNPVTYDFIRAQKLYTAEGQRRALARGPVEFPVGAIQVKAGWRTITDPERPRYQTLTLRSADGGPRMYGLAALNIAAKTGTGWLWASFEHADAEGGGRYVLRGTQTTYLDAAQRPVLLGNAVLEAALGNSASCMTCHARASLNLAGEPARLPVFAPAAPGERRGYVGTPDPGWFGQPDSRGHWQTTFAPLDFVWSLAQAAEHGPGSVPPGLPGVPP
jgi:cytochrome c peroxidase